MCKLEDPEAPSEVTRDAWLVEHDKQVRAEVWRRAIKAIANQKERIHQDALRGHISMTYAELVWGECLAFLELSARAEDLKNS